MIFGTKRVDEVREVVRETVERVLADSEKRTKEDLAGLRTVAALQERVTNLKEELETLRIEKGRKEEDFARKEREIEHKVGLERKRQEFEIEQAKREATVEIREENLKADRDRFEDQMEFHRKRLEGEVESLRSLTEKLLERLPTAEIFANVGGPRGNE